MTHRICLSSLTIEPSWSGRLVLAGKWCQNRLTERYLSTQKEYFEVAPTRILSVSQFRLEAEECIRLYEKYCMVLAHELNNMHGTAYSLRYWETLLNRFMYPLTATLIDKHAGLALLKEKWPDLTVDIANHDTQWTNPHSFPSFGGSRLLHLLIYSIIITTTKLFSYQTIPDKQLRDAITAQGDGKKDLRSGGQPLKNMPSQRPANANRWLQWLMLPFRAITRRELPFFLIRLLNPRVIALGDQYLKRSDFESLMIRARTIPFYFNTQGWDTSEFSPYDGVRRRALRFPTPESPLEESLQASIRRFLPTVFVENYDVARNMIYKTLPKLPSLILNSQHHGGGESVDFFIAHAVEERKAVHMMVCHGGCYGAMEISAQEQIWARISDSYALWSNPRAFGSNCETIKLPSLRFHKWLALRKDSHSGQRVLVLLTGYYPQRYSYNSIYPYTVDDEYDDWQIRFLNTVNCQHHPAILIRDYHRSSDISRGSVRQWAEEHNIEVNALEPLEVALRESKIAVHTVPQTTYLETLSANHPTLCFWNPKANLVRADLMPYFDGLAKAGVLHQTPESAAIKLNQVVDNPMQWWNSREVRLAVEAFRDNVCYTAPTALSEWAGYIRKRGH